MFSCTDRKGKHFGSILNFSRDGQILIHRRNYWSYRWKLNITALEPSCAIENRLGKMGGEGPDVVHMYVEGSPHYQPEGGAGAHHSQQHGAIDEVVDRQTQQEVQLYWSHQSMTIC